VTYLERTIVSLVKTPGVHYWYFHLVQLSQAQPKGVDGSLQVRGVGDVELESGLFHKLSPLGCLLNTFL
jgi:hypothetical protein